VYWELSFSESIRIWYGCFVMVYVTIIVIVTIVILTIVDIWNRRNNPLIPDTDRPMANQALHSRLDWKMKLAILVTIVLLSSGIYLVVIDDIF
jgi:divalent metal cation (Fe/Co/Zn/Cd) transporter